MSEGPGVAERAGGAERPAESGGAAPGRGGRMSRQRKTAAVLQLLRGEDLEIVSTRARRDGSDVERLA